MSRLLALALLLAMLNGCALRQYAVNRVGDAVAGGGAAFASDEDPELVRAAAPFSLKLMESLLEDSPRHRGLLLAAARGFTQYAYAFVQQDADRAEDEDLARARALQARARLLYRRARDYGLRGLAEGTGVTFSSAPRAGPAMSCPFSPPYPSCHGRSGPLPR